MKYVEVYNEMIKLIGMDKEEVHKLIQPTWSLAALLDIISYPTLQKRLSGWRCASNNRERKVYLVGEADNNPVNVCYKMILRLHELKML